MNNNTSYGFQLASDIHIEKRFPENLSITDFITPCCSTLILAGDIGSIYYEDQLPLQNDRIWFSYFEIRFFCYQIKTKFT